VRSGLNGKSGQRVEFFGGVIEVQNLRDIKEVGYKETLQAYDKVKNWNTIAEYPIPVFYIYNYFSTHCPFL